MKIDDGHGFRQDALKLGLLCVAILTAAQFSNRSIRAADEDPCHPFLGSVPVPGELTVLSGQGEVTSSSHPTLLKPGFGRSWKVSAGGYDPAKRQLMLVIKDRYFGLFLKQPLRDNQPISFRAKPCGPANGSGMLLGRMIRPGLFFSFDQRKFEGVLTKTGGRLQGTFVASSSFYLTTNTAKIAIGRAKGRFALQLKPGKDRRFPEPSPDAVRGLW